MENNEVVVIEENETLDLLKETAVKAVAAAVIGVLAKAATEALLKKAKKKIAARKALKEAEEAASN